MRPLDEVPTWDFSPAIDLLKTLSVSQQGRIPSPSLGLSERSLPADAPLVPSQNTDEELSLGNFSQVWEFLSVSCNGQSEPEKDCLEDAEPLAKEVRWRDEVSGADLEDNVDAEQHVSAASVRTRKRAARRARARERGVKAVSKQTGSCRTGSDTDSDNDSDQELDRVRRSPDRRAVILDILRRPRKNGVDSPSPPTSPSPPKETLRGLKMEWPISDPFHWSASTSYPSSRRNQILPLDNLSPERRASKLIARLWESFPAEAKFLKKKGIIHPEFPSLNTTDSGIHVFIDISNVGLRVSWLLSIQLIRSADHDRFSRLFKAFSQHAGFYTYPAGTNVLSQVLTRPRTRSASCQTRFGRIRQISHYPAGQANWLRDEHPRKGAQGEGAHSSPEEVWQWRRSIGHVQWV